MLQALNCRQIGLVALTAGLSIFLATAPAGAETRNGEEGPESYRMSRLDGPAAYPERRVPHEPSVPGTTVKSLEALFANIGYHLERVRKQGIVPRLLVREMPRDLSELRDIERRKAMFIRIALPLILETNQAILRDRTRIERLRAARDRDGALPVRDARWLRQTFATYGVKPFRFEELLRRVDIVPPSLAVAQAAEETGWGTSRFVRHGNALFGERIYRGTAGMVPLGIREGDSFRVRRFGRLLSAVGAYAANLNTHPAYAAFRARRSAMREAGHRFDAPALAGGLQAYSERREAYIETVRAIMRTNALTEFDHLRLDTGQPRFAEAPARGLARLPN